MCANPVTSRPATLKHLNVVAAVHDDEPHRALLILADREKSSVPKLSPETVVELPPVRALLRATFEMTGASKVYPAICVPAKLMVANLWILVAEAAKHKTLVADDQAEVTQLSMDNDAVADKSIPPNESPETVIELDPELTVFKKLDEVAGPSKLKTERCVPLDAATVTDDRVSGSCNKALVHTRVVAEVQLLV